MEKNLETQLLEFQKKISVIKKDSKNPHFKNTYASLTQILGEVKPVLNDLGILLTQPIKDGKVGTELSYNGIKEFSFVDLPNNQTPQQLGSAITYFRRYTLASLLALEIDDDDAQMASKPKVLSLEEKIENAKAVLIVATKENFGSLWKTLDSEMQKNAEVLAYGKDLKTKLGI